MKASPSSLSKYPMIVFFRLCFSLCSCLLVGMVVCLLLVSISQFILLHLFIHKYIYTYRTKLKLDKEVGGGDLAELCTIT